MKMENKNKDNLLYLLDDPSDVPIEQLPAPDKVSDDMKKAVKETPVNNKLYSYTDLSKQVQNMPEIPKVKTYFERLDDFLDGGLQGGELMVMSGPSGNGKSLYCQSMAYNQGVNNIPSIWFTLEMGWQEVTRKFMAMDWECQTMGSPAKLPIYYPIDTRALSLEWLEKQIIKAKRENGIEIVYIDHLHFLLSLSNIKNNVSLVIGGIVRELKRMTVEIDIPIVLIAHTKKLEVGVVPDINSVRDSGLIVNESDFMGIIWRERDKNSANKEEISEEVSVYTDRTFFSLEKNRRNGKTGRIFLGMINGKLYPYNEYLHLKDTEDVEEKAEEKKSEKEEEKINIDGII